jgi:hypothetical protein
MQSASTDRFIRIFIGFKIIIVDKILPLAEFVRLNIPRPIREL